VRPDALFANPDFFPLTRSLKSCQTAKLRFSKLFRWGRRRITGNLDLYNAFNSDTVLTQSNAYGNWQTPFSLISARFARIGVQADF
jgi:hypothetical protein